MEFGSNLKEVSDGLMQANDSLSLEYISAVSRILIPSYIGITLLTAFTFLSIPANLLAVLVIVQNKIVISTPEYFLSLISQSL